MDKNVKQIAQRLAGLREVLNFPVAEAAEACSISKEDYLAYESGTKDIPVSVLHNISGKYNIELTTLLTGADPTMHDYALTRKGQGISVKRRAEYDYQSLAGTFIHRKGEPFMVSVKPSNDPIKLNTHTGQEFNFVIEGSMQIQIDKKTMTLEEGDSIYFDATKPHGMNALGSTDLKFLVVLI